MVVAGGIGLGENWAKDARCRGTGDLAFPQKAIDQLSFIDVYCRSCKVRARCLEEGLSLTNIDGRPMPPTGVWGGLPQAKSERLWREKMKREGARLTNALRAESRQSGGLST